MNTPSRLVYQFYFMCFFQILQLQMNEYKYHYLYTKLDIDVFDLDDFKYNFVNITAFRLVDVENIGVREVIKEMNRFQQKHAHQQKQQTSSMAINAKQLLLQQFNQANNSEEKQINYSKFIGVICKLL